MIHLMDTDIVSLLEYSNADSMMLQIRLSSISQKDLATTVITYEEHMRGWLAYVAGAKTSEGLIRAYARLNRHIEMFKEMPVYPFDAKAAVEYEKLKKTYPRGGKQDLKIAAIALANDATLLTRNLQDFSKIPGLRAEDWSA